MLTVVVGHPAAAMASGADNCPNAAFRIGPSANLPDCRAFELVSPANKPGGEGVGSYGGGGDANAAPGDASVSGDRYVSSVAPGNLTPGEFLYTQDYAFSERVSDTVGWASHSPYTHREYSPTGGYLQALGLAPGSGSTNADLSVFVMRVLGAGSFPFPEMASWPFNTTDAYVTDWQGRWELAAPTNPAVGASTITPFPSADGSHVPFQTLTHGQLGSSDPSLDQPANTQALYDNDLAAGISDQFTPNGVRTLVGVCTGEGAGRTQIPNVDGSGKQGAQDCPAALPGRSAALISNRGAGIGRNASGNNPMSSTNAVSDDGSRIFFLSPDPQAAGVPASCSGTAGTTSCPTQLYLRQLDGSADPTVRWISRSHVANQAASLTAQTPYEGASTTGSAVFFRTNAPLTSDDPNGTGSAPVTTGSPSANSWDLYRYDVPSDTDGRPNAADPGAGTLTRVSAGPTGGGDCNTGSKNARGANSPGGSAALRFASDDGTRAYFVCTAPLAGVPTNTTPTDGTITTAGGTVTDKTTRNLYYYDATKPLADQWEFVAQLPTNTTRFDSCATVDAQPGEIPIITGNGGSRGTAAGNCFRGTADGKFITFMTSGQLVSGDPDAESVDVYAFDADADKLIRIDAAQGGAGTAYGCVGPIANPTQTFCHGDTGYGGAINPLLGVATKPTVPGDRIAFFQSKSRLVPEDTNDQYDVYEWHNGKLSLVSAGTGPKGSYYAGNSADGRDVFIETRDRLTWQDGDGVMDVYDVRIGGGIPEPAPGPSPCKVLGDACQPSTVTPLVVPPAVSTAFTGVGNVPPPTKSPKTPAKKPKVSRVKTVRGTSTRIKMKMPGKGKIRTSGSGLRRSYKTAQKAGSYRVAVRLSKRARRTLRRKHRVQVRVTVRFTPAHGKAQSVRVRVTFKPKHHKAKKSAARAKTASRTTTTTKEATR